MPFEAQWYVDQRVVYVRQWGKLTLQDAIGTDAIIADYARQNPDHIVHGIIDSRAVEDIAISPKALRDAFSQLPKPTEGWVVTVPGDRVSAFMTQVMAQSQHMKQKDFTAPEAALEFLQYMDDSLIHIEVNELSY